MRTMAEYLTRTVDVWLNRDYLLSLFTATELPRGIEADGIIRVANAPHMYVGLLITLDGKQLFGVDGFQLVEHADGNPVYTVTGDIIDHPVPSSPVEPVLTPDYGFILPGGTLANQPDDIETCIGNALVNYAWFALPFGNTFPYRNTRWNTGDLHNVIADAATRKLITPAQMDVYTDALYHLGHFTELCVPSVTSASLTPHPEVLALRDKLLKQYAKELKEGDATVMANIEQQLIDLDKELCKNDPGLGFLDVNKKSFNIQRKRMYGTGGMIEDFSQPGKFKFIETSIIEEMRRENLQAHINDIRVGSISRALETAEGGVVSKFLMRMFQNARISERDCGSKRGIVLTNPTRSLLKIYQLRHAIVGNALVRVDDESIPKLLAMPQVILRSPKYCHAHDGYCGVCMGDLFINLEQDALTMAAVAIGSSFVLGKLKKMHGTAVSTIDLSNLDSFLV